MTITNLNDCTCVQLRQPRGRTDSFNPLLIRIFPPHPDVVVRVPRCAIKTWAVTGRDPRLFSPRDEARARYAPGGYGELDGSVAR